MQEQQGTLAAGFHVAKLPVVGCRYPPYPHWAPQLPFTLQLESVPSLVSKRSYSHQPCSSMWHPLQVPSPLGVPTTISPAAYPEYTAAYQCAAEDPRQRIWHVFDTNRLVPEYLVELRWTLQSGELHGMTCHVCNDTAAWTCRFSTMQVLHGAQGLTKSTVTMLFVEVVTFFPVSCSMHHISCRRLQHCCGCPLDRGCS